MNWNELGLKMGLEVHQQLNTKNKLFCPCPTELINEEVDTYIKRILRPTQSELGQIDRAALQESKRNLKFDYELYYNQTCLVETDDEPPHDLNEEALDLAITLASLLNMSIVDEVHTMRKQVIDGSNTGGFQRTSLIATSGHLETENGKVVIENLCLEEDAARRVNNDKISNDKIDNDKLDNEEKYTHFRLDRLGIPLVEITTDPSIHDPEQVKEVAYMIGQVLRSTNVKRGLGTIRQDLNISIAKGARVEIKGVQDLDLIPKMAELEVERQLNLVKIKEHLEKNNAEVLEKIHDLTELFANTSSKIIKSAETVKGIVLKGFNGIIGLEVQKGRRFGTELSSYAKKRGVSGIFHTDELPAYSIESNEVEKMKKHLNISPEDAIIIVAHDNDTATAALEEVIKRAKMAFDGVVEETRKALKEGTSEYMRPLPTSNRMYLETDIPLFKIDENKIIDIKNNLPELPEAKKERIIEKYNLSEDITIQLVRRQNVEEFEKIKSEVDIDSTVLGSFLAYNLRELKREGINTKIITTNDLITTFKLLEENKVSKDVIVDIIKEIAIRKDKKQDSQINPENIANDLNLLLLSEKNIANIIKNIVLKNEDMVKERQLGAMGPLMGMSMKQLKGKADGHIVNKILKEEINNLIK
ncbi:Glu-tRNA(Gln) amidotransferase subunit GatE [Methanobrevibacter filiformis]|uniref:Glutamyl-tRNA(Gln) amidotransferase subunit E n=1 Tax=Methanobrevibacter filiformis TaxID=55758 RepID=A0A166BKH6_9EURY|nr:Glu-tRNA(Gln) amidotransferase subunit GatE [Methanobrevibacter filiformis]KZX13486.1 aspartyl/glutamyl-tRNA(Asn/Gln) amidotransferase subunit B [Methanobrevibacter filiformis]